MGNDFKVVMDCKSIYYVYQFIGIETIISKIVSYINNKIVSMLGRAFCWLFSVMKICVERSIIDQ